MNIQERFDKAIEELYQESRYLSAEITKLGYPQLIPKGSYPLTAGVTWDSIKKRVVFLFNEEFVNTLSDEEFKFVIAHETIHLTNLHVFFIKEEHEYLKSKGISDTELFSRMKLINYAADCIVNDSLVNLYKFKKYETIGIVNGKPLTPIYGKTLVNYDCEDLCIPDVLSLIPESSVVDTDDDSHDCWKSFFNQDGSINEDFLKRIKGFVEDKIDNSSCSDKEQEMIRKLKEAMENSKNNQLSKAGHESSGSSRPIVLNDSSINWNQLLIKLTEVKKTEDCWNKPNRKLISVYPDVVLPTSVNLEKEVLFVAIDSSGSIDYDVLSLFVSVVRNSPSSFKIKAISFDTECYEYDIHSKNKPRGGGGTKFNIIEEYISKNFKKYPRAVVCLTDGDNQDGVVKPQYPDKWVWLLYGAYTSKNINKMKHYDITKLMKK